MNYFLKSGGTCPERMYNPTLSKVIMVDLQKIHFAPNGFCSVTSNVDVLYCETMATWTPEVNFISNISCLKAPQR